MKKNTVEIESLLTNLEPTRATAKAIFKDMHELEIELAYQEYKR